MKEKNFLDKMIEIFKKSKKEYTIIPTLLKETFDKLIEQRITENISEHAPGVPIIFLEDDELGNTVLSYINWNGEKLQILDGSKTYKGLEDGIKVKISTFLHEFERVMKAKEIELTTIAKKKQDELFRKVQSGEIELSEYAEYSKKLAEQLLEVKSPEEYLDKILNYYSEKINESVIYSMTCNIAEGEGDKKGPRLKKTPERLVKEEFNLEHRLEGIEKLIPNHDLIVINNGEYYAYIYDLANNGNNETGYMMIVEARKYVGNATKVVFLSEEKMSQLKKQNKETGKSDIEIKAEYLKEILEDKEKLDETAKIVHRDYDKWLLIMDYYLKETKQINPEIADKIGGKFIERHPQPYLRESRESLIKKGGTNSTEESFLGEEK